MFDLLLLLPFFGAIKSQSYPPRLTDEEEKYYLLLMSQGDSNARNKLIEHNLRLVAHIAKKYETTTEEKDDILSIGIIGLIKGVDTFKIDSNNKLATYAARCIENEILMTLRANKNKKNYTYLYNSIGLDKEGNDIELIDVIKDNSPDVLETIEHETQLSQLSRSLKILNERELDIIKRRYGLLGFKAQTQKEISHELQISRSYVSRIEKRALMKLYLSMSDSDNK